MGRYSGKKCRLLSMIALTTSFFVIELVVGYVTNSMALVADSFHMLSDVVSIVIAFLSVKMSPKKWSKNTFGWARAEVLGALVNSVFLIALCFSILVESLKRFIEIEEIHDPQLILVVGCIGLFVNLIGLLLFHEHGHSHGGKSHGHSHGGGGSSHGHSHSDGHGHGHSHLQHGHSHLAQLADIDDNENDAVYELENSPHANSKTAKTKKSKPKNLNMHGVFLHVLADALGSVVVIVSALVIWLTEWEYKLYVDPALSVAMVCLIMWSTWPLLHESALILLQTVPTHIQLDDIQRKLLSQVEGVLAVHEFHVWQLAGDRIIASAHIRCRNLSDYMKIAERVKEFFHNEGIHSTTIQPEFTELPGDESASETESCALDCPAKETCEANTCCGPSKQVKGVGQQNPTLGDGIVVLEDGRETEQLLEITANDCRQRSTANGLANRIAAPNPLPRADESGADELMLANSCCAEQEAAHSRLLHDVNSIAIKA
ncbi:zinc/cadmium resistance protein-like isoform X4 [Daphnia pulicaria]|nr:zinc/cadmium resistance protein-like isoform X4 [Daphnia pulicaria]XP_046646956.1 zinc/cadmium resistance protein-like isoform X4 [Daphnia pulicaria]